MKKNLFTLLVCVLVAAFSFIGTTSAIAGDTPLSAPGRSFCNNANLVTQNASIWWFAFCVGDGFTWYSGY